MHLVRLFKVTRHFRQQLVPADSYVDGKAQFFADFVFHGMGNLYRVWIEGLCAAHIQKAFVNAEFFDHRRIPGADRHKSTGIFLI